MKIFLLTVFWGIAIAIPVFGIDEDALSVDSTSDQVSAVLDHLVNVAIDKDANRGFGSPQYWVYSGDTVAVANKLDAVSFKVLLDVLNQTKQYDKSEEADSRLILKREALYKAMKKEVTDTDLPDLLASPAVEALWIVCSHPSWQHDPAVTSFLTAQLGDMPPESDQTPNWLADSYIYNGSYMNQQEPSPGQTRQWTVLNLASLDDNPAVQKLLVDTIRRGLDKTGTPTLFFCDALSIASHSKNPDVISLTTDLMARLVSIGKFPYERVYQSTYDLVNAHPELVKDQAFDSAAIGFIKDSPYSFSVGEHEDWMLLARLGDSVSFGDALSIYFDKDSFSDLGSSQEAIRNSYNSRFESTIFSKIVYRGSGNRLEGIKEHYHSAVFQDGIWTVTGPDDTASAQNPALAPTPAPASPHPLPKPPVHVAPPAVPNASAVAAATSDAPAPQPSPSPALPDRVAVTARAPIETLDGTGQVTAVGMAAVGTTYHVVRADGKSLIVQDASGTQYRIASQATAPPAVTPSN